MNNPKAERELACNYEGRLDYIRRLLDECKYAQARDELKELLSFVKCVCD